MNPTISDLLYGSTLNSIWLLHLLKNDYDYWFVPTPTPNNPYPTPQKQLGHFQMT